MTSRILSRGSGHSRKWGISILLAWRSLNYPVMIRSISKDSAAKSLQSCPTLCDPIDGSPPGSSIAGILQARTPEWVAISFSNAWKWSHSVVSNSWRPYGLQSTRPLCPWDFSGKSTGVECHHEYSGLISFRIDWFDLFAVQGTLKSLLQHHNEKSSILWCSAFFMVQFSYP